MTGPEGQQAPACTERVQLPGLDVIRQEMRLMPGRLGATAAALACTEDRIADMLERIARHRPDAAERLRDHAVDARQYAIRLRYLAGKYDRGR